MPPVRIEARGIRKEDVFITLVDVKKCSFNGIAQYA
jgi:hypothetical protein